MKVSKTVGPAEDLSGGEVGGGGGCLMLGNLT